MIQIEETYTREGEDAFFAKFRGNKFWHTVRCENGDAIPFLDKEDALEAARKEWAHRFLPPTDTARPLPKSALMRVQKRKLKPRVRQ